MRRLAAVGPRLQRLDMRARSLVERALHAAPRMSPLWALGYLIDKGVLDRHFARVAYATFLASAFRPICFGLKEAHGRGVASQIDIELRFVTARKWLSEPSP